MFLKKYNFLNSVTIYILVHRLWIVFSGIITVFFVTIKLNPVEQGWFLTFISLTATYYIFEMGLSSLIQEISIKKSFDNRLRNNQSDPEFEFIYGQFIAKSFKIYLIISLIFFCFIYITGLYVFSNKSDSFSVNWELPWFYFIILTAVNHLFIPIISIIEGNGAIKEIYKLKIFQGILGLSLCWLMIWHNYFLWSSISIPFAHIFISLIWLCFNHSNYLNYVKRYFLNNRYSWAKEILPTHFKFGITSVSIFVWSQLATPILFNYQGPIIAGKFSLTLTIAHSIGLLSQFLIAANIVKMTELAHNNNFLILKKVFVNVLKYCLCIYVLLSLLAIIVLFTFDSFNSFTQRILSLDLTIFVHVFVFIYLVNILLNIHLRLIKNEPLMLIFLIGAIVTVILTIFAMKYSLIYLIMIMLLIQLVFIFPLSFYKWKLINSENLFK